MVSSPLGNEVARIESDRRGATLTRAGAAPEEAASFQALTERLFGVALAPDEVAAWLHGERPRAAPGGWAVTIDETQPASFHYEISKRLSPLRDLPAQDHTL